MYPQPKSKEAGPQTLTSLATHPTYLDLISLNMILVSLDLREERITKSWKGWEKNTTNFAFRLLHCKKEPAGLSSSEKVTSLFFYVGWAC